MTGQRQSERGGDSDRPPAAQRIPYHHGRIPPHKPVLGLFHAYFPLLIIAFLVVRRRRRLAVFFFPSISLPNKSQFPHAVISALWPPLAVFSLAVSSHFFSPAFSEEGFFLRIIHARTGPPWLTLRRRPCGKREREQAFACCGRCLADNDMDGLQAPA
ncbi:hypothetical protein BS50DRAFT_219932 [Corynespora cassiicola Philippines]|uniref:Transmembrane protein n=1 Tax=Corynespora cassiicola Philippines TaxID=1448308 RepID=A0A2T2N3K1_CORCC|nr:hypothetical protein BS50DRAFT_219932 [Corynespora cassiicola Philippines]